MPNLRYIFTRLRAMSPLELLWRFVCQIRDRREIRRRVEGHSDFKMRYDIESGQAVSFIHAERLLPGLTAGDIRAFYQHRLAREKITRIKQAEDCLKHTFSIYGLQHSFAETIDWHLDWLARQTIPVRPRSHYDLYSDRSVTEVKFTWEFNRHAHFFTLALASVLTEEKRYLDELQGQWLSWIEANPLYFGINWTSALEVGFRLINWTYALALIKSAPVPDSFFTRVLHSVEQHAEFIAEHPSRFSSANNHLLGEAVSLMIAGICYPGLLYAEKWRKNGFKLLFRELPGQVHRDGVTKEQSTGYQRYVLEFGLLTLHCAQVTGQFVPDYFTRCLHRMADACLAFQDSNGNVPNIGDSDDGSAFPFTSSQRPLYQDVLNICAVQLQTSFYKQPGNCESVFWFAGLDRLKSWDAFEYKTACAGVTYLSDSGYLIIRQVQPVRQHFVMDAGALGFGKLAAHGHADALSLNLSVDGQPLLIDSGTWMYLGAGKDRAWFRGTAAHNTMKVDRQEQSLPVGPFQWGRRANAVFSHVFEDDARIILEAEHDGYSRQAGTVRRRVEFDKANTWTITDKLEGSGLHDIELSFHLCHETAFIDGEFVRCSCGCFQAEFSFASEQPFSIDINKRPHSIAFGRKQVLPVIIVKSQASCPFELRTLIKLYGIGDEI